MTPEMKDNIPEGWHTYTLGEIYTERKEAGDPELPILTVSIHSGVSDGALDEDEIGKTVKRIADKTQYKTARAGDLVFNMMRAWQGAIGVARSDGLVSPAYIVAAPNEEQVFPLFMDYYMKTTRMVGTINRQSYGVTDFRKRLYWDSFAPIKCTLPSIPEQQKIAEILTAQDKVIELQEKLIAELTKLKKAYLSKMFPRKGEKVPKLRFRGFTGDWEQRKLKEIASRITRKNKNLESELALTISAQYGLVDQETFFNKKVAAKDVSGYYLLNNGEFAYNKSSSDGYPVGAVKRLDKYDKGVVSTLYICFGADDKKIDSDYLATFYETDRWVTSVQERAAEGARNHGLLNIGVDDFFDTDVIMPPSLKEQRKVASYITNLDNTIALHHRKLKQEKQKKKALMQLLLTGIVRIKQ